MGEMGGECKGGIIWLKFDEISLSLTEYANGN